MQKYIAAEQRQAYLSHWIRRGLRACEHEMRGASGRFTIGDSITMADCFVLPQLAFARRFNVDVSDFSELLRVAANLEQVEAVRAAAPEAQPDKDSAK
jgi:glutathione S-transferase